MQLALDRQARLAAGVHGLCGARSPVHVCCLGKQQPTAVRSLYKLPMMHTGYLM